MAGISIDLKLLASLVLIISMLALGPVARPALHLVFSSPSMLLSVSKLARLHATTALLSPYSVLRASVAQKVSISHLLRTDILYSHFATSHSQATTWNDATVDQKITNYD